MTRAVQSRAINHTQIAVKLHGPDRLSVAIIAVAAGAAAGGGGGY
jgi:hypothetical protein